jgi:hypothetical protein
MRIAVRIGGRQATNALRCQEDCLPI